MGEQWERLKGWITSHKALAAFLAIGLVLGAFLLYRKSKGGLTQQVFSQPKPSPQPGGGRGDSGGTAGGMDLSGLTDAIQQESLANEQTAAAQQSAFAQLIASLKDAISSQTARFNQQIAAAVPEGFTGLDANGNPTGSTYVKTLNTSFAKAQGGNPNPGRSPATFSNPAPGGSWGGQTGGQIQQNFIAAAGGNVAQAATNWTAQHNAEVAQNGF